MTSLSRFSFTLKSKFIAFALGDVNSRLTNVNLNLKYNIEENVNQLNNYYASLHALLL
jgi:flagellar hook-associated protein FlgK